jgi:hypothetical protein
MPKRRAKPKNTAASGPASTPAEPCKTPALLKGQEEHIIGQQLLDVKQAIERLVGYARSVLCSRSPRSAPQCGPALCRFSRQGSTTAGSPRGLPKGSHKWSGKSMARETLAKWGLSSMAPAVVAPPRQDSTSRTCGPCPLGRGEGRAAPRP